MQKKCIVCGKIFEKQTSDGSKYWKIKKCCSLKCAHATIRRGKYKNCCICNKSIYRSKHALKINKTSKFYCSRKCLDKGICSWKLGQKHTEQTKQKLREARAKQVIPAEVYRNNGLKMRGENHPMWKGGFPKCLDCKRQLYRYDSKRCRKCAAKRNSGNNMWNWKGGKFLDGNGYLRIMAKRHPRSRNGYVKAQYLVAEKVLGRYLNSKEMLHHINGIKTDNRKGNLYLFPNNKTHRIYHFKLMHGNTDKITKSNLRPNI